MSLFDDVEADLAGRSFLHSVCSGDFTREEEKVLLELRERVRLPFSYERATRVVNPQGAPMTETDAERETRLCWELTQRPSPMDLTRPARPEDMDKGDGCGR